MNFKISCSLDQRRADSNGFYPVRLRVYNSNTGKAKRYPTIFKFKSKDEFERLYRTDNLRGSNKELHIQLHAIQKEAIETAASLSYFNFEDFERLMFNKDSKEKNINFFYQKRIERFLKKDSISTSKNYELALKCLLRFHGKPILKFEEVTVSWLEQFEKHCVEVENKSLTTVSIYVRTLRTVFNDAKADKTIKEELYPFGKRKYQIPAPKNTKKALSPTQLKVLFEAEPQTPEQEKAKSFWFFSYLSNGMNFKDILNLKYKNIDGDKLSFVRAKTSTTNRSSKPITIYLNEYTKGVIEKYGNNDRSPDDYVFPFLNSNMSSEQQYKVVKNFVSMVNQNFLKYAKSNGIEEKISSYWARHSFTTMAVRNGASMEMVGEAVGHTNTKTTMNYFKGFDDEAKREMSSKLLDF